MISSVKVSSVAISSAAIGAAVGVVTGAVIGSVATHMDRNAHGNARDAATNALMSSIDATLTRVGLSRVTASVTADVMAGMGQTVQSSHRLLNATSVYGAEINSQYITPTMEALSNSLAPAVSAISRIEVLNWVADVMTESTRKVATEYIAGAILVVGVGIVLDQTGRQLRRSRLMCDLANTTASLTAGLWHYATCVCRSRRRDDSDSDSEQEETSGTPDDVRATFDAVSLGYLADCRDLAIHILAIHAKLAQIE